MKELIQTLWTRFRALGEYAIIAGIGVTIDTTIFLTLAHFYILPVFWASVVGILCGASFAYFFATRRIFVNRRGFEWRKWAIFITYILLTMFVWSGIIASLVAFGLWPILAKCAILPVSFYTNFLFMGWLQEGRIRWH